MKIKTSGIIVLLLTGLLVGGCGYYFPHVYDGPTKTVYMPEWKNRTNRLGLDARLYQTVSRWFQKSDAINLTKKKDEADLILAGEIVYIDVPSVSWDGTTATTDIKVRLGVRFVLKDLKSGEILWEVPNKVWTEDYSADNINATAESEALEQIVDDISEYIYLGTLKELRSSNRDSQQETEKL